MIKTWSKLVRKNLVLADRTTRKNFYILHCEREPDMISFIVDLCDKYEDPNDIKTEIERRMREDGVYQSVSLLKVTRKSNYFSDWKGAQTITSVQLRWDYLLAQKRGICDGYLQCGASSNLSRPTTDSPGPFLMIFNYLRFL